MLDQLPKDVQEVIRGILAAEVEISYAKPERYNAYIADACNVTAVSASGRYMKGANEVCDATVMVSAKNSGEHDRHIEWIACNYVENMAYVVFKSGVKIDKEDNSGEELCWIITLIVQKTNSGWKLVHRHNTRSNVHTKDVS